MSKRSRRQRRQKKQQNTRLTLPELIQRGTQALKRADYDKAVEMWQAAQKKPNAPASVEAALAEAYFRRAVSSAAPPLSDLQRAVDLQPAEPRYHYHLALGYHRRGQLDQAEPIYRRLLAASPPFDRAAAPLAQLLIEQKRAVLKDPVWDRLSPEEQARLAAAEALIKRKSVSTLERLTAEPLGPFWQGVTTLALGDKPAAGASLQAALEASPPLPAAPRSVARYYLGLIAAEAGQTDTALAHWRTAQAEGLDSPQLRRNLAVMTYDQTLEARQAGRPDRALHLVEQIRPGDVPLSLAGFKQQLKWEAGYAAAQKGKWAEALTHWQQVEAGGDNSRRLIFNLALAYQNQEQYWPAAQYWRTLLRRRPRKADHPEALTDQQVARIWQNVAENYSQAGEYDESIKTYKNAVKWAPDNLDLRLKLVETYQIEGRWQAAENELHRILDKNPDHVPALTLLAESYSSDYFPAQARQLWRRILDLEPDNPVARQQLAHTYVEEGRRFSVWGEFKTAIKIYQEGLKHTPHSQPLLTMIGGTYADWGKFKQARSYLDQAIAVNPHDLPTLYMIYQIWLDNDAERDRRQTFEQIKAVPGPVPGALFLDMFQRCLQADRAEEAAKILDYVETRYAAEPDVLTAAAASRLDLGQEKESLALLRRILQDHPTHVDANIQLGLLYHRMDQTRLAKRYWDKAEAQAKQANNLLQLHQIKMIKDQLLYGKAPPSNPVEMFLNMPPEIRDELLENAPPEVAAMLRNIDPDTLEMLFNMGGLDDFDDEEDIWL